MNVWVFLGSLFILVCVCTVVYAICKLVSIVDETRDRTETLARNAVRNEAKINTLADKISQTKDDLRLLNDYQNITDQTVSEDRAEISALHDHFDNLLKRIDEIAALDGACAQLLMRVDDLEKKLEKGGAQIERETGHTGKKC